LVGVLIMGGLGTFYFQMHRGTSQNVSDLPNDFASKGAFLILEREFSGGASSPVHIVVEGDASSSAIQAAIARLKTGLADSGEFAPTVQVQPDPAGDVTLVDAFLKGDPSNDAAFQAIRDLRSEIVPTAFANTPNTTVLVGGDTAFFTDFLDVADRYQWIVLAFVLTLSFILLTVVFRSVVVPFKAILMNLLSVGAAYGALTLVFQKGVGIGLFNAIGFQFKQVASIEAWLPLFLFSVLFGLSMDYHVFLLTRIREEYDKTRDNTEAVAYGLRTTAGIITGAAIIMVAVFTAFASGRIGALQQMGFGLAVAVFLDATIVRTILVPATMRLLGDVNWYLPRWLQWLPQLNVEGHEPTTQPEVVTVPSEAPEPVGAREDG
jgi:RND superfamily putative drug exporter